ncbi:DUF4124 domain-containing protein [Dyella telluris]|uniref:DUF4124 domain-containing protein n=1 Tax=Dyella telluris TaxID=2763498 RepID=A0A7G8PZ22_9GAMM|nr:DUF4124 domain-containing protein [Dyella telluris]QNJ99779.1 DUF4124 domain-containing protein [Dyella telluris]
MPENGWASWLAAGLLLLALLVPGHAHADIYKCVKGGSVAYQESPCEGSNVQATHIEDHASDHFVGCFAAVDRQYAHYYEVRANGAGTYQLLDERNPLGSGSVLKQATPEELAAVGSGLHIKITGGLSRYSAPTRTVAYTSRIGNRYVTSTTPVAQPISAYSLYGIYTGKDAGGQPVILLYSGGGLPQIITRSACPTL